MHPPTIFCLTCGRYLGAAAACILFGWQRPAALWLPAAGAPLWRLPTAAPADGHPLPLGDRVILADRAGALAAVSAADGAVRWRWAGDGPLRGQLAGRSNRVYAARREGGLLALTLPPDDGGAPSIAWRFPLPSSGAPALDEGRIYVGSGEGTIYALTDAGDRAEIAWQANVGGRVALAPVRWRHLLLVATSHAQGHLIALDAGRGTVVWSQPLGARAAVLLLCAARRKAPHAAGAASAGDEVIVITDRGLARAFGLPDGEPSGWTFQVAGSAPVAAGGAHGALYLAGAGGQVVVLPATGGEPRQLADFNDPVIGLVAWEGLMFAACRGGILHVLEAADGAHVGQWSGSHALTAGPLVVNGTVLVGGEIGWTALPWHLGQWRWAAARYRAWGNLEAAAACHALAGELDAAEQTWLTAGTLERPAWLWTGLGEDRRAAAAFRHAADAERARHPALAAAYLNQAADRLEACEEPAEAAACRGLAGRMGRFPHLRLAMANLPAGKSASR